MKPYPWVHNLNPQRELFLFLHLSNLRNDLTLTLYARVLESRAGLLIFADGEGGLINYENL